MEVTVHSVYDRFNNEEIMFGIGDFGYKLAMDFMNSRPDHSHKQFEYFGTDEEIDIRWDMTEEDCRSYVWNMIDPGSGYENEHNYCGAMFFGNFKLEFIMTPDDNFHNLFHYGVPGYDELEDGTPYGEEYGPEKFYDYPRRTFEAFARKIEEQIVPWLNEYTQFINDATKPTNPKKWYPGTRAQYMRKITRKA